MSIAEKITILEYCQDSPNFDGNGLMVELKMTILAAVGPMSFECINELAIIHYVGTQPSRVRKAPNDMPENRRRQVKGESAVH
jgi:hypothetical protein